MAGSSNDLYTMWHVMHFSLKIFFPKNLKLIYSSKVNATRVTKYGFHHALFEVSFNPLWNLKVTHV